tara:strand:+ start:2926 stop:3225 length:300 start_codon:yes stop_codon:yes gene_type:complete
MSTQSTNFEGRSVKAGQFLVIGRRDDTGEIVVAPVTDIPRKLKMTDLCKRVLLEMGQRDPLVFEFISLVYAPVQGGAKVVLDQGTLRRFVYARWGRGKK